MSLRTRIAAIAGLAVAVTVLIAAGVVYFAVRDRLRDEVDRALEARAEPLAESAALKAANPGSGQPVPEKSEPSLHLPPQGVEPFGGAEGFVQFVDRDGDTDAHGPAGRQLPVSDTTRDIAAAGSGGAFEDINVAGTHLRVLILGIGGGGAVQVSRPLTEVDGSLERILLVLALVGVGGIALAALLGTLVASAGLEPIVRFTRRTEQIAGAGDISQRIEASGDDELARLARSFNSTLDGLERSIEAQRHLVADASHELRTPISSLRANIQTLEHADRLPEEERSALRADIIAELDELTALVGDVVELARGAKPEDALDEVRLDEIVESLVGRARGRGGSLVDYTLTTEPTLIRGEPDRITRAVGNLLDNARKWSPPQGPIEVELRGGLLSVRDHGPGIDDEDLPHVFERFYRSRTVRGMPGSGLGLAIVRQAAEAHGGSAEAVNAMGGGAVLRVRFGPTLPLDDPGAF